MEGLLSKIFIALFLIVVCVYGFFELRDLLGGPKLTIAPYPEVSLQRFIKIRGTAERIAKLSMNGFPLDVSATGTFEAPYVLADGSNFIAIDASDQYKQLRHELLKIVFDPLVATSLTSNLPAASSTATSTATRKAIQTSVSETSTTTQPSSSTQTAQ